MSNEALWANLSKDCSEHSGQMVIALSHIIPLIPDPDGAGMEAHDLLKMLHRLETMHNTEVNREINSLERNNFGAHPIKQAA